VAVVVMATETVAAAVEIGASGENANAMCSHAGYGDGACVGDGRVMEADDAAWRPQLRKPATAVLRRICNQSHECDDAPALRLRQR